MSETAGHFAHRWARRGRVAVAADRVKSVSNDADEPHMARVRGPRSWCRHVLGAAIAVACAVSAVTIGRVDANAAEPVMAVTEPARALATAERGQMHREVIPPTPGKLLFPLVPGEYCWLWSASFGRVPSSSPTGRHEGTDIMSPEGQPVIAVVDGVLARRYASTSAIGSGYGWSLFDESTNTTYRYFHMTPDPAGWAAGDRVSMGDVIGYVGDTGAQPAGNFHLHFEVRPNDVPVDPLSLLDIPKPPCSVD